MTFPNRYDLARETMMGRMSVLPAKGDLWRNSLLKSRVFPTNFS